ncbi:MAG: hypothetical protein J7K58_01560 [Euryarchaeota archaeon]|nr:hypothetical protein [Euryarchaeota archaeon]
MIPLPKRHSEITFIVCDCMLGRLAKMLRILGYVVYYDSKASDKELLELSKKYKAILITRDLELSKLYEKSLYLKDHDINAQLDTVLRYLKENEILPMTQILETCPECGTPILECDREYVKGNYYESTYCAYESFYYCPSCKKLYWKGYQYKSLLKTIRNMKERN